MNTALDGWTVALNFVWRPENDGQAFHITANDPGKGTSWGVTEATWGEAVGLGLVRGALSDASKDDLGKVLKALFWDKCQCDGMDPAIGVVVFNMAMVCGVGGASKILQRAVGADVDGQIGPQTLAMVKAHDPASLVTLLTARDVQFFDSLSNEPWFHDGWDQRAVRCYGLAIGLLRDPLAPVQRSTVA
jgi:lysozyme family protein